MNVGVCVCWGWDDDKQQKPIKNSLESTTRPLSENERGGHVSLSTHNSLDSQLISLLILSLSLSPILYSFITSLLIPFTSSTKYK